MSRTQKAKQRERRRSHVCCAQRSRNGVFSSVIKTPRTIRLLNPLQPLQPGVHGSFAFGCSAVFPERSLFANRRTSAELATLHKHGKILLRGFKIQGDIPSNIKSDEILCGVIHNLHDLLDGAVLFQLGLKQCLWLDDLCEHNSFDVLLRVELSKQREQLAGGFVRQNPECHEDRQQQVDSKAGGGCDELFAMGPQPANHGRSGGTYRSHKPLGRLRHPAVSAAMA
jgi:hypothetical protein